MWLQLLSVRIVMERLHKHLSMWIWSPFGTWWDSLAGKFVRHGTEGLLSLLIIMLLVSPWVTHKKEFHIPAAHLTTGAILAPTNMVDRIVAAHLFGQPITAAPVQNAAAQSISVDGIVYAESADVSQAVLTINGKTDVYKTGQHLPDGETLAAIGPNEITLAANGADHQVSLPRYGDQVSEGPVAYAALFHETGSSTPEMEQSLAVLPLAARTDYVSSVVSARVVGIPATTTPLEQLRALRSQLVAAPH